MELCPRDGSLPVFGISLMRQKSYGGKAGRGVSAVPPIIRQFPLLIVDTPFSTQVRLNRTVIYDENKVMEYYVLLPSNILPTKYLKN